LQLIGLISAFIVIIIIVSRWQQIPLALALGMLIVAFSSSIDLKTALSLIWDVISNPEIIERVLAVILILLLSALMNKASLLRRLLLSLKAMLKNTNLLIAIIPALVGFLPIAGGTILSAPFVDKIGNELKMNPGIKSAINTFFFFFLVYFNPLVPMLIVITDISTLSFGFIIKFFFFPAIISLLIGLVILTRFWPMIEEKSSIRSVEGPKESFTPVVNTLNSLNALKDFFIAGSPIILTLTLAIGFSVNFIIALLLAIVLIIVLDVKFQQGLNISRIRTLFIGAFDIKMGFTVLTIYIFGAFIQYSGVVSMLAKFISHKSLPLLPVLIITSIIIGFVSGNALLGAAIVYPVFTPLIGGETGSMAYLCLILAGLMFGYVLSPIHLCLIVSNAYYKVGYRETYPLLFLLQAIFLILVIIVAYLLLTI